MHYIIFVLLFVTRAGLAYLIFNNKNPKVNFFLATVKPL